MPNKLCKTKGRDLVVKHPHMTISRKAWLAGINNAREQAIRDKVRFIVPDEGISEDYRDVKIGRLGCKKCIQCLNPWYDGMCECGQSGVEEDHKARYWLKCNNKV